MSQVGDEGEGPEVPFPANGVLGLHVLFFETVGDLLCPWGLLDWTVLLRTALGCSGPQWWFSHNRESQIHHDAGRRRGDTRHWLRSGGGGCRGGKDNGSNLEKHFRVT